MAATLTFPSLPRFTPKANSPTFDEVAAKVDRIVGDNPTPDKYWAVQDQLTTEELAVLVDGAPAHNPIKTETQRSTYTDGAARALGSADAEDLLEKAANDAVAAAQEIDRGFLNLQSEIARIDVIHHSGFGGELTELKGRYDTILSESRDLAARLSAQTDIFDAQILPMVNRDDLTVDQKIMLVDWYIGQLDTIHSTSRTIEERFESLKRDFTVLVAKFSTWATDKEGELTAQVEQAKNELIALNASLGAIETSLIAFGGIGAMGLMVTGVSVFFGPLGFFLAVGGMIALGVSAATIVGLLIARDIIKSQIANKEREIQSLEAQIEQIRKAREGLTAMGDDYLVRFGDNVNLLKVIWNNVAVDATTIKEHLESSKIGIIVGFPTWIEDAMNKGNDVYQRMARYLTIYATGLGNI